jgi:hypothetical protein
MPACHEPTCFTCIYVYISLGGVLFYICKCLPVMRCSFLYMCHRAARPRPFAAGCEEKGDALLETHTNEVNPIHHPLAARCWISANPTLHPLAGRKERTYALLVSGATPWRAFCLRAETPRAPSDAPLGQSPPRRHHRQRRRRGSAGRRKRHRSG